MGIGIGVGVAALLRIVLGRSSRQNCSRSITSWFLGGLLILWIGVKLLTEAAGDTAAHPRPVTLWHAVWMILIADVTMSTDNILAGAGLSKSKSVAAGIRTRVQYWDRNVHQLYPSAGFMDRYPVVMYIGAVTLGGRVGGDMIISDPWIQKWLHPSEVLSIGTQVFFTGASGLQAGSWPDTQSSRTRPLHSAPDDRVQNNICNTPICCIFGDWFCGAHWLPDARHAK